MSDLSISEKIIEAVICRLQKVRKANGFRTDAGLRVFRARKHGEPAQEQFTVSSKLTEYTGADGSSRSMTATKSIEVSYSCPATQDDDGVALEIGAADARKALLLYYGGIDFLGTVTLVSEECFSRDEGASHEGVVLTINVTYREGYGDPYANSNDVRR